MLTLPAASPSVYPSSWRVEDVEVDDKGIVYAPTQPGLGYEIDWHLVEREAVDIVR